MKSSARFRFVLALTWFAFVAAAVAATFAFYGTGREVIRFALYVALGGALFFVAVLAVPGRRSSAFSVDFRLLVTNESEYGRLLGRLGESPLSSLILYLGIAALYVVLVALVSTVVVHERVERVVLACLLFGIAMLSGAFLYVIADTVVLSTLGRQGLVTYPRALRADRQLKKTFIIPLFMTVMSLFIGLFASLLVILRAPDEALSSSEATFFYFLVRIAPVVAGYLVIVLVLMMIWNRNTGRLYKSVVDQLDRITSAEKDVSGRITIGSVDELATIAGNVNVFCDTLASSIRGMRELYGDLNGIQGRLLDSLRDSSSNATSIASDIDQAIAIIETEDRQVDRTLESAEQLALHVQGVAEKTREQSASVGGSVSRVESMMGVISTLSHEADSAQSKASELAAAFKAGETNMKSTVQTVSAVAERSASLAEINKLISDVASRTNLLAMNASIEAAHAGDAGRGFSVVAEEIRKLAESTTEHTRRSKESLHEILSLIERALAAAEETGTVFSRNRAVIEEVNRVTRSIAGAMAEQERQDHEILELLGETTRLTVSVAETARSLDGIARAMMENLKAAVTESKEARTLAETMRHRNAELRRTVGEVDALATQTAELHERVADRISGFRTE